MITGAVILHLLFDGHLPTQQRLVQIEAELREVYAREAQLLTRLERELEAARRGTRRR